MVSDLPFVFEKTRPSDWELPRRRANVQTKTIFDAERRWVLAVFDEAHKFRNGNQEQIATLALSKQACAVVAMTATPIQNRLLVRASKCHLINVLVLRTATPQDAVWIARGCNHRNVRGDKKEKKWKKMVKEIAKARREDKKAAPEKTEDFRQLIRGLAHGELQGEVESEEAAVVKKWAEELRALWRGSFIYRTAESVGKDSIGLPPVIEHQLLRPPYSDELEKYEETCADVIGKVESGQLLFTGNDVSSLFVVLFPIHPLSGCTRTTLLCRCSVE